MHAYVADAFVIYLMDYNMLQDSFVLFVRSKLNLRERFSQFS